MQSVKDIESVIATLTPEELRYFREWFEQFDAQCWEKQLEQDAQSGRLDAMADQVTRAHKSGRSTPL